MKLVSAGTFATVRFLGLTWDWVLAVGDSLEERGLSTSVLTQKTVTAAVGQLHDGVGNEDTSVENEGDGRKLDITRLLQRRQNTGCDTIGQAVLVHLLLQSLDLIGLLGLSWGLSAWGRLSGFRGFALLCAGGWSLLRWLSLSGALGLAGCLRCGNHDVWGVVRNVTGYNVTAYLSN